jgi:uncharacterized membrane-anchored protein
MKPSKSPVALLTVVLLAALPVHAAEQEADSGVLTGPAKARMGNIAAIELPAGFVFLDGDRTRAMMREYGEPVSGQEVGMLMPTNSDWSVFFDYADVGYVKDDDKDELDADKLLQAIQAGNEAGNKERRRNGVPPLNLIGWEQPPRYDESTHNLEWAIRFESQGQPLLNYNTRLLGRKGYMSVVLVVEPDALPAILPEFRQLLSGYDYQSGESYAEYRQGDKVAKYGLAALVVGGAAVGAAKLGLFAWLLPVLKKGWYLIVAAFAAVASFFKRLFLRKTDGPQG